MERDEWEGDDSRTARTTRRRESPTDRLPRRSEVAPPGEPLRQDWRSSRSSTRPRRAQSIPSSRGEFALWLQRGGWKVVALVSGAVLLAVLFLVLLKPRPLTGVQTSAGETGGASLLTTVQPSVTPAPPTPTANPQTGATFRTTEEGVRLRPEPNTNQPEIKMLPAGAVVTVIGEDFSGPDYVWKNVRDAEGAEGWIARDFLEAVP